MSLAPEDEHAIDEALRVWRQGDVSLDPGLGFLHLADLSRPHSSISLQAANTLRDEGEPIETGPQVVQDFDVRGAVMLSQTCDVVRSCKARPFVEVAPLVKVSEEAVEEVRRLKRSAYAHVPATAQSGLVADLERVMTVEKALVAGWNRTPGWDTDTEQRHFAFALSRKRTRFPFPDDFVAAAKDFQGHLTNQHHKSTAEGEHLRALREIRVLAAPSWQSDSVEISWWFIKYSDPENADWSHFVDNWIALFRHTGRFRLYSHVPCRLEDITAQDYVVSDHLDLDRLSSPRHP